jgi:aminoglycoside phosphotransferase (APT) family kinase protein
MAPTTGPRLAQGRTAEIFAWGDARVVKLFREDIPESAVMREFEATRLVHQAGLPVPSAEAVVEVDGRRGIVFERVEGPTMLCTLASRPWTLAQSAHLLAELHVSMHRLTAAGLPPLKERLARNIHAAQRLPDDAMQAALRLLDQLPDGNSLCHGDFHPDNVLMSSRGPIIIDWPNATQGNPFADVARTSLMFRYGAMPPGTSSRWLIEAARRLFHRYYLKRYLKLRRASRQEIEAWQLPVAAARLNERIPGEERQLLALIHRSLNL